MTVTVAHIGDPSTPTASRVWATVSRATSFIVFEVNGWHNVVHIATGALLLLAAPKGPLAATVLAVIVAGTGACEPVVSG